jgi:hypothetical protein
VREKAPLCGCCLATGIAIMFRDNIVLFSYALLEYYFELYWCYEDDYDYDDSADEYLGDVGFTD